MIKRALVNIFLLFGLQAVAQQDPILMRINEREVHRSEFKKFCNKVDAGVGQRKGTPEVYANLFVNFKLKVAAAEAAGLDTTRLFREAIEGYRRQLTCSFLTDEADVELERVARRHYDQANNQRRAARTLVSHVFKKLPQNISTRALRTAQAQMDSIYNALQKSGSDANFDAYVQRFSDEKKAFWTAWLQMPVEFEEVVLSLPIGQISRPFFTPQGIHIVKVLEKKGAAPFEEVKEEVVRSQTHHYGLDKATAAQIEKLKQAHGFLFNKEGVDELLTKGATRRVLFRMDGKEYTGQAFVRFALAHPAGVQRQLDGFVMKSVLNYEASFLEQKHPELREQMQEYRDKKLLEAVTRSQLGAQGSVEESTLKDYFEQNRSRYFWKEPRYKGIVLQCTTKRVARQARKFLKEVPPSEWMNAIRLTFNSGPLPQMQAQQGVFASGDNAFVDELIFKGKDAPTADPFPIAVVSGKKLKGPEEYQEVRNVLITDYRNHQEKRWNEQLRAASKVEINQEVLKTVNNH